MDQARLLSAAVIVAVAAALSFGVAACGGDDKGTTPTGDGPAAVQVDFTDDRDGLVEPEPALDPANRQPRGASVNYSDPPPPIAAAVQAAADTAKCTVTGWASEANPGDHGEAEAAATITVPPLSGAHNEFWADWGVYDKPVPYKHQLHNLEHGGVIIHYGRDVPVAGVNALRELWAKSPAFVMVVPDTSASFPKDGVVVGSQQQWMSCKPFTPAMTGAIQAYIDEYRGRGPEPAIAQNTGADRPEGLPAPKIEDKGAK